MRNLTVLIVVAFFARGSFAEVEMEGTLDELQSHFARTSNRVILSTDAKIEVETDRAVIRLMVATRHKKLSQALADNQRIRAELTSHLESKGIPNKRVKSSRYSSTPREGLLRKTGSYDVHNTVAVTVDNEAQLQAVAEFADENKYVSYQSIAFEHTNEAKLKLDVIMRACENLVAKKNAYEKGLGVKLELLRFSDTREQLKQRYRRSEPADYDVMRSRYVASLAAVPRTMNMFTGKTFSHQVAGEFEVVSE